MTVRKSILKLLDCNWTEQSLIEHIEVRFNTLAWPHHDLESEHLVIFKTLIEQGYGKVTPDLTFNFLYVHVNEFNM